MLKFKFRDIHTRSTLVKSCLTDGRTILVTNQGRTEFIIEPFDCIDPDVPQMALRDFREGFITIAQKLQKSDIQVAYHNAVVGRASLLSKSFLDIPQATEIDVIEGHYHDARGWVLERANNGDYVCAIVLNCRGQNLSGIVRLKANEFRIK